MKFLNVLSKLASVLAGCSLLLAPALAQTYVVHIPVNGSQLRSTPVLMGTIAVGATSATTAVFLNMASNPVTPHLTPATGVTLQQDQCSNVTLAPGQSCSFGMSVTPQVVGAYTNYITVTAAEDPAPWLYNISATVVQLDSTLQAEPALFSFGSQKIGEVSAPQVVTITNIGAQAAEFSAVVMSGNTASMHIDDTSCDTSLDPGQSCVVTLSFQPISFGRMTSRLMVQSSVGARPLVAVSSVSGTGVQGLPQWAIAQLNFNNVPVGDTSPSQTAVLQNVGDAPLLITDLSLQGDAVFNLVSSTCGDTLEVGATCQVEVSVTPLDGALRSATINLSTDSRSIPLSRVQLYVRATADSAILTVSPINVDFGVLPVGQTGTQSVTLQSTGTLAVSVSGYALSGAQASEFTIVNAASCTGTLAPGQQCILQLSATPAIGVRNAQLTITSTSSTPVSTVSLKATGAIGLLQAVPTSLSLGPVETGQSGSLAGNLTNTGTAPVLVGAMSLAGADAAQFTVIPGACNNATLAPTASCTYSITYHPALAGAHTATMQVVNNGQASPVLVTLSGTGTLPPAPLATLTAQACTPASAGAGTLITCNGLLQNTGTVTLTIGATSVSGAGFTPPTSGCTATLAPGQTCVLSTTISSIGATTPSGTLTVQTNAGAKSVTVTPNGTGPAPAAAGSVALGSDCGVAVDLGKTASCTLTVSSSGLLPLTVTGYSVSRSGQNANFTAPASCTNMASGSTCTFTLASQLSTASYGPCGTTACAVLNYSTAGTLVSAVSLTTSAGDMSANASFTVNPVSLGMSGNGVLKTGLSGYIDTNFTLANTGSVPVRVTAATLASITGTAGQFIISGGSCVGADQTLSLGQSCTLTVGCNGSAVPGTLTGSLVIAPSALSVSANGAGGPTYAGAVTVPAQALTCQMVAGQLDITSTYPGWTTVVPTNTQSGNWRRATNSSLSPMTISSINAGTNLLVYTDSANSTHCNAGKVLAPGANCDFLELVTKTNTSATPFIVAPNNSYINTSQGQFAYSPSYSVAALALTSTPDATPLQWGETRDVVITVRNNTPGMASDVSLAPSAKSSVKSNSCATLAPGATCQIVLTLAPDVASPANAGITSFVSSVSVNGRFEALLNNVLAPPSGPSVLIGAWTQSWATATPVVTFTPNACNPASALSGVLVTCSASLQNTGLGSISLGAASVSGSGYSAASSNCGASLAPAQSCTVTTTITSIGAGTPSGILTVQTGAGAKSATVTPNGAGAAPAPAALVAQGADCGVAVNFGMTATCTLTVTSTGQLPLTVSGYTVTRAGQSATFTVPSNCAAMAAGTSCTVSLQSQLATTGYAPCATTACTVLNYSQAGTFASDVSIATGAGAQAATASFVIHPVTLSVSGNGTMQAGVTGTVSTDFSLFNGGIVPVKVTSTSFASITGTAGQFVASSGTCLANGGPTLAAGQSCTVTVTCIAGSVAGTQSGSLNLASSALSVTANGTGGTSYAGVANLPAQPLTCQVIAGKLDITSAFPGWTSTIPTGSQSGNWRRATNSGLSALTISSINAGTNLTAYVDTANTGHCNVGKVLAPNGYCDFMEIVTATNTAATPLVVAPTNSYINTSQGVFTYAPSYAVAALTATSAPDANVLQWGETRDVVVTVVNNTPGAASDLVMATSTGSSVKSTTCLTIAAGASCTVTITLSPAIASSANATIKLITNSLTLRGRFERVVNGVAYAPAGAAVVIGGWTQTWTADTPKLTVVMGVHPSTSVGVVSTAVHHVTNSGTGTIKDMTATIATAGSLFTVTANTCPAILAPLGECDVTTSITPAAAGVTYTDSLNLNYFGLVTQGALSLVPGSSPVKMLVQGPGLSFFYIGTDNVLYGTGVNGQGQLGTGDSKARTEFLPLLTNVAQASSGAYGTLALRTDGTFKGTGMAQLYGYGGVFLYTFRDPGPGAILTNLRKVVAGINAGYYLKNDDTLWITGTNTTLGNDYALRQLATGVADVSVTAETILILKTDGTVWSVGANNWGQLGVGTLLGRTTFTQVMTGAQAISAGQYITSVLKTDGTLWTSGYFGGGGPSYPYSITFQQKLSGVSSIAAADYRVMALKTDGNLWLSTATGTFIQKESGVREITSCLALKFDNSIWNECVMPVVKIH